MNDKQFTNILHAIVTNECNPYDFITAVRNEGPSRRDEFVMLCVLYGDGRLASRLDYSSVWDLLSGFDTDKLWKIIPTKPCSNYLGQGVITPVYRVRDTKDPGVLAYVVSVSKEEKRTVIYIHSRITDLITNFPADATALREYYDNVHFSQERIRLSSLSASNAKLVRTIERYEEMLFKGASVSSPKLDIQKMLNDNYEFDGRRRDQFLLIDALLANESMRNRDLFIYSLMSKHVVNSATATLSLRKRIQLLHLAIEKADCGGVPTPMIYVKEALYFACMYSELEIVRFLIEVGFTEAIDDQIGPINIGCYLELPRYETLDTLTYLQSLYGKIPRSEWDQYVLCRVCNEDTKKDECVMKKSIDVVKDEEKNKRTLN